MHHTPRGLAAAIITTLVAARLLVAQPAPAPAESAEAAKVAAWVKALPAVAADWAHFAVIGGVSMVHIGGPATDFVRASGPAALYHDAIRLSQAKQALEYRTGTYGQKLASGGLVWQRDVQNFPWGMIEVSRGETNFGLADAIVKSFQDRGMKYVGTVMPYAGWELKAAGYPPATDEMCTRLLTQDFFYLDADDRMDRFRDTGAWLAFLAKLVERYDGDGRDDMPGLREGIEYWQIHNEPEGDRCGLYRNDVGGFVDLMRDAHTLIHESCPSCKVLQGGAGIPQWRNDSIQGGTFWRDFAAMGGSPFVDVIAIHYNDGKVDGGSIANFETQVSRLRETLGKDKPVWVTEFGVITRSGGSFLALTEKEAAAWYVRFYSAGLAAGVERFFSDAPSFIAHPEGTVLLPFYANKLLETKLGGFTSAEKIVDGQYRFRVAGADRYVVWNGVPSTLTGRVTVTDLYGNESVMNAAAVSPSEGNPLILSPVVERKRPSRR